MICVGKHPQGRTISQVFDHPSDQLRLRESVTRSLQEQHWNPNLEQVLSTIQGRLTGGMEGKSQECQSPDTEQRRGRLGLRCHPPAE
jgi:hypothetical protein